MIAATPIRSSSNLLARTRARPLPGHVGIIMDGNGTWAERRGLSRYEGHRAGSNMVREVTRAARTLGIRALTLYAFSEQNWARPAEEVLGLMQLLRTYLLEERREVMDNGIRLEAIGDLERLPASVRAPLEELRSASAKNTEMVLTLALSYGGREEILRACRLLAAAAMRGEIAPEAMTERHLDATMWSGTLPRLDLVIRPGGERRLSNFMLWHAAYAELVFTPVLWPDFGTEAFLRSIGRYQARERRFGLTPGQVLEQRTGRSDRQPWTRATGEFTDAHDEKPRP